MFILKFNFNAHGFFVKFHHFTAKILTPTTIKVLILVYMDNIIYIFQTLHFTACLTIDYAPDVTCIRQQPLKSLRRKNLEVLQCSVTVHLLCTACCDRSPLGASEIIFECNHIGR